MPRPGAARPHRARGHLLLRAGVLTHGRRDGGSGRRTARRCRRGPRARELREFAPPQRLLARSSDRDRRPSDGFAPAVRQHNRPPGIERQFAHGIRNVPQPSRPDDVTGHCAHACARLVHDVDAHSRLADPETSSRVSFVRSGLVFAQLMACVRLDRGIAQRGFHSPK
jgi:hypothetical protein